jgi:hypothetical protein
MKVHVLDPTFLGVFEAPLFVDDLDGSQVHFDLEYHKPDQMRLPILSRRFGDRGTGAVLKAMLLSLAALAIDSEMAVGRIVSWLHTFVIQNQLGPFQRGRVICNFDIRSRSIIVEG